MAVSVGSLGFDLRGYSDKVASDIKKGMRTVEASLKRMEKRFNAVGKKMSLAVSLPLVALGAKSVKTFATFEQAMAKVNAVSGSTQKQFAALEQNARKLGATTRFTATEVSGLQLAYSKLGFNPDEIVKTTKATLALAQATDSDLARSAEVAGGTLRGFQLDVNQTSRVTDVMAKSFSSSALDIEKYAESMKFVAPNANLAGVSLERTTAMLSVLSDNMISGSQAGTAMRRILNEVAKTGLPVQDALRKLAKEGLTLADAEDEVGRNAQTALLVLTSNIDKVDQLTNSYNNASGSAQQMANIMDATAQGAFARFSSAMESMFITVGGVISPVLIPFIESLTILISKFSELSPEITTAVVILGALAVAIGPVMIGIAWMTKGLIIFKAVAAVALKGVVFGVLFVAKAFISLGRIALMTGLRMVAAFSPILIPVAAIGLALAAVGVGLALLTGTFQESGKAWGEGLNPVQKVLLAIRQGFTYSKVGLLSMGAGLFKVMALVVDTGRHFENLWILLKIGFLESKKFTLTTVAGILESVSKLANGVVNLVLNTVNSTINTALSATSSLINKVIIQLNKLPKVNLDLVRFAEVKFKSKGIEFEAASALKKEAAAINTAFKEASKSTTTKILEGSAEEFGKKAADALQNMPQASDIKNGTFDFLGDRISQIKDNAAALKEHFLGSNKAVKELNKNLGKTDVKDPTIPKLDGANFGSGLKGLGGSEDLEKALKKGNKGMDKLKTNSDQVAQKMENMASSFSRSFARMFDDGKVSMSEFGDVVLNTVKRIGQEIIESNIKNLLLGTVTGSNNQRSGNGVIGTLASVFGGGGGAAGAIGNFFGGFFADGGQPPMGKVSVVGERGPELFVPNQPGTILPNGVMPQGGGDTHVTVTQNFSSGITKSELGQSLAKVKKEAIEGVLEGVRRAGSFRRAIQA